MSRLAGAFALGSGVAYLAYLLPISARDGAISAWNLLIIPTSVYLGVVLAPRGPVVAAASTAAAVVASLLWAFDYKSPTLEPVWIGLAAFWWFAIGWLLRRENPRLGWFTLILSAATAIDFVLTALNAPFPIYALGGFKIPLTIVWTFWVGVALVRGRLLGDAGRPAAASPS